MKRKRRRSKTATTMRVGEEVRRLLMSSIKDLT
jgi:hypothetical protein